MRDALVHALELPLADATLAVRLSGNGPSFCSGGDLQEFGLATDPAAAHLIRMERSVASLIAQCSSRVEVRLHGATIGAGLELASLAGLVVAQPGTWFRLPELAMGLIPGAGGCVGVSRRIGRWRTAFMALSGCRVELITAREWGLVDA